MSTTIHRALVGISFGLVAAAAAPGCSFISNETAIQCTSEAECLSLGPEFEGTTCDPSTKTCIKVATDVDLCTTNKECVDKAGGEPAICRRSDRKCVALYTPECRTVLAKDPSQIIDDNTIVIGALTPAAHTELGDNMQATMALAQLDFSTSVRGLPSVDGSGNVRPIVVLACKEFNAEGFDALIRAANHLAYTVQVPLVIGPVNPSNANFALTEVFVNSKTLVILPFGGDKSLAALTSGGPAPLTWAPTVNFGGAVAAGQEFLAKYLEPQIKTETGNPTIKVTLMYEDTPFSRNAASYIQQQIRFNGKDVAGNLADGNFQAVNIGSLIDPVGNPAPAAKIAAAVNEIVTFHPDLVIHHISPAAIPPALFALFQRWNTVYAGQPHAYHLDLLTTFTASQPLWDFLSAFNPALRPRVFGTSGYVPPEKSQRITEFIIRFRDTFKQFTSATAEFQIVHEWFDSFYLAAYAIAANGNRPLTGENLASTITKLQPGSGSQVIPVGPNDINRALTALNAGQGIDLDGIAGTMDLDPRTGLPNPDYPVEITCAFVNAAGPAGRVTRFKPAGFHTENTPNGVVGIGTVSDCGVFVP